MFECLSLQYLIYHLFQIFSTYAHFSSPFSLPTLYHNVSLNDLWMQKTHPIHTLSVCLGRGDGGDVYFRIVATNRLMIYAPFLLACGS